MNSETKNLADLFVGLEHFISMMGVWIKQVDSRLADVEAYIEGWEDHKKDDGVLP